MKRLYIVFFIITMTGCIKKPVIKEEFNFDILYQKGVEYYTQRRYPESESIFKLIVANTKEKELLGKSYYYQGRIAEVNNRSRDAILYYSFAFNFGYGDKDKFLELIRNVHPSIVEKELRVISETIKPDVLIIISRNYIKEGDNKNAGKIYKIFLNNYPNHQFANEARNFLKGDKILKIAVVLPLSGDYSEIGKFVKEGVERYGSSRFSLFYYDNREDYVKTYNIMKDIASKKFDGVVGPLLTTNAVISSIFANLYEIPMVSPTASSNIPDGFGNFYLSINKSSLLECYAAADYAFNFLNGKRAAVVFPETEFGRKSFNDFKEYFESIGGKVVYSASFLKNQSDFKDILKDVNRNEADVLFIPGNADDLILIIPQIKFYNVRAHILGNSGWKSYELINKIGKDYFEGVTIFEKEVKNDNIFKETTNPEELKLKQLGYDAMKLLDTVLSGEPSKGFGGMNLLNMNLLAGSIDVRRDILSVNVFVIKNGKFINIKEK